MKHTLVATMDNNPFTFNRVISLFRSRGFVIDSLTIGQTDIDDLMRLTIVVDGSRTAVEQVVKQLTEQQVTPFALGPDRFGELISKDLEKWAGVIKTAGIKGE